MLRAKWFGRRRGPKLLTFYLFVCELRIFQTTSGWVYFEVEQLLFVALSSIFVRMKMTLHRFLTFYREELFYLLLLTALMAFPLFAHLDGLPFRMWDESRVAVNAYEMFSKGNFFVAHFKGEPDLWNTKPLLLVWLDVVLLKLLGPGELAIRLPSAIAALFTGFLLFFFSRRYLGSSLLGFVVVLILITSWGYVDRHGSRTGDYDALLVLFTTLSGLSFFLFCESKNNRYLYGFFVFTFLGVLTKSIAALLFVPALALYTLFSCPLSFFFRNRHFYLGLFFFFLLTGSYYAYADFLNPGYLRAVFENEWGGRYLKPQEGNAAPFGFYLSNLLSYRWVPWAYFMPLGMWVLFCFSVGRLRRFAVFSLLLLVVYLLVISSARTKLAWYDLPMYPFLAFYPAVFLVYLGEVLLLKGLGRFMAARFRIFESFVEADRFKPLEFGYPFSALFRKETWPFGLFTGFVVLLFAGLPYLRIVDKVYLPKEKSQENKETYCAAWKMREAMRSGEDFLPNCIVYDGYKAHLLFYFSVLRDRGEDLSFKYWEELESGDTVLVCQEKMKRVIEANYFFDVLAAEGSAKIYAIHGAEFEE